jgi:hypothetical protein
LADGWCWFLLREEYCWLVAGGWFVVREKYCWLVADKPSEQGVSLPKKVAQNFLNFEAWWWSNPLFTESVITRNRVIVNRLNRNCFGGTGSTSAFLCSCVCV